MREKRKGIEQRKNLRDKAEDLVKNLAPKSSAQAMEILMHELMVHKVELEMQNEELQSTQHLIEESRDSYVDFYEFAPVGFITLSRQGLISKINLTGCVMLGVERFRIMSRRLSSYIAPHDKDRWHRLFMHMMEHTETDKQAFDLEIVRADGTLFHAYFNCIKWESSASHHELRIAMTDISKIKLATI